MTVNRAAASNGSADTAFLALVAAWSRDQAELMLGFVWQAYDAMKVAMPVIDRRDVERSITQLLEPRIRDAMTGDEPFYIQHGPFERETMMAPPAQPPAYDLAFILRADERIMWPLEAKVLETPGRVADYERDVRLEYLTCRYAPFSQSAAMLAYLLTGTAHEAFDAIAARLGCQLVELSAFPSRPHRISNHDRTVPVGKAYPRGFVCHHLVFEFQGISRELVA